MKYLIRSKQKKQGKANLAGAFGLLLALGLVVGLVAAPAVALPPPPPLDHYFYGQVTYSPSGEYVEAGTWVRAEVDDPDDGWVEADSIQVVLVGDEAWYGLHVFGDDTETPAKDGAYPQDVIRFYVGGVLSRTWGDDSGEVGDGSTCILPGWCPGGSDELDLEVEEGDTYNLTVTSDGCCPITVGDLGDVAAGATDVLFPDITFGTEVLLTADDSDPCCDFVEWVVDGGDPDVDNPITVTMDADHTAVATCTVLTYDLTVTSEGCCPIDVAYDTFSDQVAAGGSQIFADIPCGTDVTVTADDSNSCCEFVSWSDGGAKSHAVHMDEDKSITATCTEVGMLTLTVGVVGNGNVEVDAVAPGAYPYDEEFDCCTWVHLEAKPDVGWVFTGWSDGLVGDTNPTDIHMDEDKTVTANFAEEGEVCNLTVTSEGCCPIDVAYDTFSDQVAAGGSQIFADIPCGTDVTVTADDSNSCCEFVSWSDGGAKSHAVHMDDDKSVTATCTVIVDVLEEVPLSAGWNTFSTPIVLHPCSDYWHELKDISGLTGDVELIYYYDSDAGYWGLVYDHDEVTPLEGFYVKLRDESVDPTVVIIPDWDDPDPAAPQRKLLTPGLNFIGMPRLEDMDVYSALMGIFLAPGIGYSEVWNPEENPNDWVGNPYIRDDTPSPTMVAFKAYWVNMGMGDEEPLYLYGSLPPTPPTP